MDPATGEKDWLPDLDIGQTQTWPVELGADRLVLLGSDGSGCRRSLTAYVFDRDDPGVEHHDVAGPARRRVPRGVVGPDGPALRLRPGHPGPASRGRLADRAGRRAEDADAEGDTYHLWSVSLTDRDRRP